MKLSLTEMTVMRNALRKVVDQGSSYDQHIKTKLIIRIDNEIETLNVLNEKYGITSSGENLK